MSMMKPASGGMLRGRESSLCTYDTRRERETSTSDMVGMVGIPIYTRLVVR